MTAEGPLDRWASASWPGASFVREAETSGRLAVLYAASLGAWAGHDYVGCEHLVAGSVRAMAPTDPDAVEGLRRIVIAAVAASQLIAEVPPERVDAWFADAGAADPETALRSLRLLPTLSWRAERALQRARDAAATSTPPVRTSAAHLLAGVLADPGIVAPTASALGVSLEPGRRWADRHVAWGPLLDLLADADDERSVQVVGRESLE